MERDIYLEHYRLSKADDGAPVNIGRNGPAITYKGSDSRSGAPVALTLVPISSVDPDKRRQFEEKARTALLLDHLNIAKTVAFDTVDDEFVFVSEFPQGETAEAWVAAYGAMPADAVLRIALQVISALGAASFHGLTHPAIQPANLIIVSGKTAESGWPLIKLAHFALAGLKSAPGQTESDLHASDYASPEQLLTGEVDFRSEIYSLGATMCFLLTGVLYSAYPRWPQTKRFLRPLRTLIARTLQDEPSERPQDPILFAEEVRNCLTKIERWQAWEQRTGMPLPSIVKKDRRKVIVQESDRKPRRGLRTVLASVYTPADDLPEIERRPSWPWRGWAIAAAILLLVGIVSALLLPEDVVTGALHRKKSIKTIGVPVGVPEAPPPAMAQSSPNVSAPPRVAAASASPIPAQSPAVAEVKPSAAPGATLQTLDQDNQAFLGSVAAAQSRAGMAGSRSATPIPSTPAQSSDQATLAANTTASPPPPAEQPSDVAASPNESKEQSVTTVPAHPAEREVAESNSQLHPGDSISGRDANDATTASKSRDQSAAAADPNKTHPTRPRTARTSPRDHSSYRRVGTFRARVVGVTPNGNVIVVLPSGERAIVSPRDADENEPAARVHGPVRRAIPRPEAVPQPGPAIPPYQPFLTPDQD